MDRLKKYIPLIVVSFAAAALVLISLKIIGYGYLPQDDALRHAAKAISGKPWSEILVLRSEIKMDDHPGWHAILGFIHESTGWDQDGLVVFSIVTFFLAFCIIPVFFLKFPEFWLLALFCISLIERNFIMRLFLGRPYIISMAVVLIICFLWQRLKDKGFLSAAFVFLTVSIAILEWIHGVWYLLWLPILACCLAREWRVAFRLSVATALGFFLGACPTGNPFYILTEYIKETFLTVNSNFVINSYMVGEFRPFGGDIPVIFFVCSLLVLRYKRGEWDRRRVDNPIFLLGVIGWLLGFIVVRFWVDWGLPALTVWVTLELQDMFKDLINALSWRRILLTTCLSVMVFLSITNDSESRWTSNVGKPYLSQKDPAQAQWLPQPGGIIYSSSMAIFYDTFFHNPDAPWRYMLGFSPWMPLEDQIIYRNIRRSGEYAAYEPWIKKMRPQDRLAIILPAGLYPPIPQLEWYRIGDIWIGRLLKKAQ